MRYVQRNRGKVTLLIAAFTLVWLLPLSIGLLVKRAETQLRARAVETPLLLGKTGSALELTFNGLYFTKPAIATLPYRQVEEVRESGLAEAIPLYARFSASGYRIVGTSLEYFDFRGLEYAEGRPLLRLGECVIGATVAKREGLEEGDSLISSPETLFDLAGVYPLKMKVVGILAPSSTPDDNTVFVDPKTTWIIEGLGHGHVEASQSSADQQIKTDHTEAVKLNASVVQYNEVTPENAASFHFHGEIGDNPFTSIIVIPNDAKSQAIIKGRYATSEALQLISPEEEMDELFATVFGVQQLVLWLLGVVGAATLLIGGLVFLLSYRLRREEFGHLRRIGADMATLRALIAFEAGFVILSSMVVSGIGLFLTDQLAPFLIRSMLG
ncbi:MAG: ABC transporter permease [Verrucomicrobiota bacterium]|nr:ABC transporter permease [Verrucomicrobiota bacterium]